MGYFYIVGNNCRIPLGAHFEYYNLIRLKLTLHFKKQINKQANIQMKAAMISLDIEKHDSS